MAEATRTQESHLIELFKVPEKGIPIGGPVVIHCPNVDLERSSVEKARLLGANSYLPSQNSLYVGNGISYCPVTETPTVGKNGIGKNVVRAVQFYRILENPQKSE